MKKNPLFLATPVFLVLSFLLNVYFYAQNNNLKNQNLVISVIDGDTFILKTEQRIRLSNIYAPELELCGGPEAKKRLENLILNKIVKFEPLSLETFNRSLANVYVDNLFVNEILLKEGLARYDGTPNPKREILKNAYDYAFERKIGIHSLLCRKEEPEKPKCLIKGNVEKHNNTKSYYFPGCANYQQTIIEKDLGESWFCTEKEAEAAGFEKSQNCYGKKYNPG